ncbi:importin-alpha export receptor [Rhizophagus clarus]|uniref:Importin-alpha export receptor n=1 Tax=Rhizophagus clarus TaxID=94130 RepID=A0A8H3LQ14_9GLOM|nr:importin-alpha export receptor [Rhizophagus clarus]
MYDNEQYLATLAIFLEQTLDPSTSKHAEQELFKAEAEQKDFPIAVMQLVTRESTKQSVRFAASLLFKNYIRRNWVHEDDSKLTPEIRTAIKESLVDILVSVPSNIQLQLSESVTLIAENDFPEQWPNLITQLTSKFSSGDFARNNAVLQTAHSIFKKYKSEFRTDPLYNEINFVLDQFVPHYWQLLQATDAFITQYANDKPQLQTLSQTLLLLLKLFYDLNWQDLPPFFEDNIDECMSFLHKYLTYNNPLLDSMSEDEAGPLEKVKSIICEICALYATKYEEVFTMLQTFVETVWTLLTTTGLESKYDILVSKAMAFLSKVVKLERYSNLFAKQDVLTQFCEKIILPNMYYRPIDEELFEYDPIEFIRRDLEGSDSDTRRRSASDFVRSLMTYFQKDITTIIWTYINQYLQRYTENPRNWKDKDAAIYLLTSIAAPGSTTKKEFCHGVTTTNEFVDVVEFFSKNMLPDLQTAVDSGQPVLKVDSIKYVYTFRNQMTKQQLISVFPLFTKADIKPYTQELLINLFRLIEAGTTPETLAENDYLMKAVMRVIFTSHDDVAPYVSDIMGHLNKILVEISKNPSNPRFNHCVFESIGALVRFNCQNNPEALSSFENMLFGPFQMILQQDVVEFVPYVFQIFSQLLELHTEPVFPEIYRSMLPALLTPAIWENAGNIPALTRLLHAYICRDASSIVINNQLEPILGIFQKLIASKTNDKYGVDLLCSIVQYIPTETLNKYLTAIITLLLTRMKSSKTDKYTLSFVYFVCFFLAIEKEGVNPDYVIQAFDSMQHKLFFEVLNAFIIPEMQKIQDYTEKKICAVAMTRLLTQSEKILTDDYITVWPSILAALIKLFEAPTEIKKDEEEELLTYDFEEERQFQSAFARLTSTGKLKRDPTERIEDPKIFLAHSLQTLSQRYPGKINDMISSKLPPECTHHLVQYMNLANPSGLQLKSRFYLDI